MPGARHPLIRLLGKRRLRVLGINSGTSIDGLDLALVEIADAPRSVGIRPLAMRSFRFGRSRGVRSSADRLRESLRNLAARDTIDKCTAARTHAALGSFIADCVIDFQTSELPKTGSRGHTKPVDLIASHGQTIGHFPVRGRAGVEAFRATWQIGALNTIAQRTGIVTIGDFRAADVAAGGMGAPLSGYYHHLLFGSDAVVLNIGGIANLSASRLRRGRLEIRAFDVGPGNMLSDALARRLLDRPYDRNGTAARRGRPDTRIIGRALAASYFRRRPPKTCGREEFGDQTATRLFFRRGYPRGAASDLLASAVEITVQAIAFALARWIAPYVPSRTLIVTGGGARNRAMMARLRACLPHWQLSDPDDWGIPAQFVEPVGFALLAHETIHARAGNLGGATGADPAVLGLIALPGERTR